MKKIILTILIAVLAVASYAQKDTEFWFVAPEATDLHGDVPIYLRLAGTGITSTVTISQPANPNFTPIIQTVGANNITSVNLTAYLNSIENRPANVVLSKGLLIEATEVITAYYEIANGFNPEIFPLKGKNALGTDFYLPAQNIYRNELGSGGFDIVATENGTIVTILPTDNIIGHSANIPFTIILNKGETFSCRATSTAAADHLGGSHITSNKPIAVTINDDSLFSLGAYDIIGDQLVPTSLIGTEYIAVKGLGAGERVFITATEDNTDVFVDGNATAVATLSEGQLFSVPINNQSVYINSTKPVYAYHLSGHSGEIGDAVLPPIACTGSDRVSFIRPGNDQFSMMILVEASNVMGFSLNGVAPYFAASLFQPVPGNPTWVSYRFDASTTSVPVGINTLSNTMGLFHLGILYNYDGFSSEYGYFSNYSSLNIGDDRVICEGQQLLLDAGNDKNSYLWSTGDTTQFITVSAQDTYYVAANYYNCQLKDTIILQVNEVSVDLEADISMCAESDTIFIANSPNTQITYEWQDGSTDSFYIALDTGAIHVTITDTLGCEISDTAIFSYYPVIELGNDTSFVCDSISFLITSNLTNATYLWHDGSMDSSFLMTSDGLVYVDAIDENNCFSTDTLFTAFVSSPVFNIGNDTIVCPDESVIFNANIPGGVGYLWQDGTTGAFYTTDTAGIYIVRAVDTTTCFTWDTLVIDNFIVPDSLFGADTLLCNDETYLLEPTINNAATFTWQDGSTNNDYLVTTQGLYDVEVIDINGCITTDTIEAYYLNDPSNSMLPEDTTVCWRNPILLNAAQTYATSYQWSGFSTYFGENDYTDSVFLVRLEGFYQVAVTNECGTITHEIEVINEDCSCEPFIPNAFTPNNDGNNDRLEVFSNCEINDAVLSIFSHKGTLIYHTTDITQAWDGTFQGQVMPNGVYIWHITFESADRSGQLEKKTRSGDVTIVR
jgi:gliding motility-associated-like protein